MSEKDKMNKIFPVIMYAAYISIICIAAESVLDIIEKKKRLTLLVSILTILLIGFGFQGNEKNLIGVYSVNIPVLFILNIAVIIKEMKYLTKELIASMVIFLCTIGCIQYILYENVYDVLLTFLLYGMFIVFNEVLFRGMKRFLPEQSVQNIIIISILVNSICYSIMVYYSVVPVGEWINQHKEFLEIALVIELIVFLSLIFNYKHTMVRMNETIENLEYVYKYSEIEHIEKMYNEAKKLRHDIKHSIIVAKGFIDEHEYENAKNYMDELIETKVDAFGYTKYCDNQVINYIINDKRNKCLQSDVEFKCVVFGKINDVHDVDLSILIGNLLDNAIEAAERSEDKIVNLEIYDRSFIEIVVENSIAKSVLKTNPGFLTTKRNHKLHGYGMKSITEIVDKYSGEITYEENNQMINCKVILLKS